ncbi:hypothetical protein AGMMS49990_05970 [Endomicrobiia bacterium]|nr:hypothetical protein AGMMS49990_05970 [Endomicrobiia bacterium]
MYIQAKGRDEKTEYVKIAQQVGDAIRQYLKALLYKPDDKQPLFVSISNRDRGQRMTTRSVRRVVKRSFLTHD